MDAATVAEAGYRGLMKNKPVIIPGFKNSFLAFSVRFVPRKMAVRIARKLQSRI
jgi:short-subunit dehydrogenase